MPLQTQRDSTSAEFFLNTGFPEFSETPEFAELPFQGRDEVFHSEFLRSEIIRFSALDLKAAK